MAKTFKDFAEACWDTHKQVGFKMKGGKRVPNCVPKNEDNLDETSANKPGEMTVGKQGDFKIKIKNIKKSEFSALEKQGWFKVHPSMHKGNRIESVESNIPYELYDLSELGPAAMKRRARMRARMGILQKKYGDASKAGIHPSRVSQRHNKMTVKKGK